ncbi:hypothetical protein BCR34DRAFT_297334 [Clohesyomyces aquaticus]|uniref:Uncharacterized protein n=1 Tax=Clohesyomyces aquaticus TaxID=1231657 RepID=A0A1Y1ZQH8_9PLEO|nr:hypothetical protein BCR34DRAFT_297334 [Clohesyomyces aquaticus]
MLEKLRMKALDCPPLTRRHSYPFNVGLRAFNTRKINLHLTARALWPDCGVHIGLLPRRLPLCPNIVLRSPPHPDTRFPHLPSSCASMATFHSFPRPRRRPEAPQERPLHPTRASRHRLVEELSPTHEERPHSSSFDAVLP